MVFIHSNKQLGTTRTLYVVKRLNVNDHDSYMFLCNIDILLQWAKLL